ncbi:MAG: YdcF family protein [Clostridia bacterium]|nr:YdcF family protein [Clostridia bacterium]
MRKNKNKRLKTAAAILICAVLAGALTVILTNVRVVSAGKAAIITKEAAAELEDVDCVIVLGCLVKSDGEPSDMLRDRLVTAIGLYKAGAAPKLLMSGDHGIAEYDEVNAMKKFAVDSGVPSEDVFMDHAGFSTYETVYRAKEVFCAKKVIIVTQEYHLYRALYTAERLGLEAYGVTADLHTYRGQNVREIREVLARAKDLIMCIFKPEPTYLGEAIPVSGNGDLTKG